MTKQILKRLSQAMHEIDWGNDVANEMSALIDAGEWGQTSPDYSELITRFKLDHDSMVDYLIFSEKQYRRFNEADPRGPKDTRTWEKNPWYQVNLNLEHLFYTTEELKAEPEPRGRHNY